MGQGLTLLKALGLIHAADDDAVFDEQVCDFFCTMNVPA